MYHDVSVADYLRGLDSPAVLSSSRVVQVAFPAISERNTITIDIDRDNLSALEDICRFKTDKGLKSEEAWTLSLMCTYFSALHKDQSFRLQVVRLRMLSFFLLIHSRVSSHEVQEYITHSSSFLMEVIAMSDLGSEMMSMLRLRNPFELAHVAMELVLGLLESKLRRRSSITLQSNILLLLDLERTGINVSLSTSECWINIVTSACSLGGMLFSSSAVPSEFDQPENIYWNSIGKFIRLGLELFALALNTRSPQHVVTDAPLIGVIVGLLNASISHVKSIVETASNKQTISVRQIQVLLVVTKAMYCLELTMERQGYLEAFRESSGLQPIVAILNSFSEYDSDMLNHLFMMPSVSNILDGAMAALHLSLQKGRLNAIGLPATGSDTGMRTVQDPSFLFFAQSIFGTRFAGNEVLWGQLISVLREVIDTDPSFLSQFLQSKCAEAITVAFFNKAPFCVFDYVGDIDMEKVLVPLARLSLAMSVTAEGKQFVDNSRLVDFIIDAVHHRLSILPQSLGISPDRLAKIGKILAQLLLDNDLVRVRVRDGLRFVIRALCREAESVWMMMDVDSNVALDSPRMQVLQKLTNICTMVETMFTTDTSRRHSSESVREILADVVPALFSAYKCTLPPCNQMLAQLSIKNTVSFPHLGHSASAKAIYNVLKVGVAYLPQLSIPIIFKEINETLGHISAAKQSLTAFSKDKDKEDIKHSEETGDDESDELEGAEEGLSKRSRSRGSSLGNQTGVKVYILGALNNVPHLCISDPSCDELWAANPKHKYFVWKFMQSVLYLEWLATILSHALRSNQRASGLTAFVNEKDVFRRLFAFYRSSLQEIYRFAASRLQPKVR
ncbi:hypothetical protein EON65_01160 [archaeon]|nr:MAG: hypothetical protein EON65_01160 [archaeon]